MSINSYGSSNEKLIDLAVAIAIIAMGLVSIDEGSSSIFAPRTVVPNWYPAFSALFDIGIAAFYFDFHVKVHHKRK
eukprot:gene13746-16214_t